MAVEPTQSAGKVEYVDGETLQIASRDSVLQIESVQPAGKREMAVAEFLRGNTVSVGQQFG